MTDQEKSKPKSTATDPRRRWPVVATVACFVAIAGLLAAWIGWNTDSQPENVDGLHEVAGLPVPATAPDLDPTYGALLEESKQVACGVVESFPNDAQAVATLAMVHDLAHDEAGAIACWRRCLELDHNHLMAYSSLAPRFTMKGDHQEAERLLREAIQVPGGASSFAEYLALVLTDQGKFPEAARVLEDSLVRQPSRADTHVQLGEAYLQLKALSKAKEQFEKAIQLDRSSLRGALRAGPGVGLAWSDAGSRESPAQSLCGSRNPRSRLPGSGARTSPITPQMTVSHRSSRRKS